MACVIICRSGHTPGQSQIQESDKLSDKNGYPSKSIFFQMYDQIICKKKTHIYGISVTLLLLGKKSLCHPIGTLLPEMYQFIISSAFESDQCATFCILSDQIVYLKENQSVQCIQGISPMMHHTGIGRKEVPLPSSGKEPPCPDQRIIGKNESTTSLVIENLPICCVLVSS